MSDPSAEDIEREIQEAAEREIQENEVRERQRSINEAAAQAALNPKTKTRGPGG